MSQGKTPKKPVLVHPSVGLRGMTRLQYAAYCNDPRTVDEELRKGGAVNARDDLGRTALHWSIDMAEAWGDPERVVSLLLKAGASVNAVDGAGTSVLMVACGRNNVAIFLALLEAGADAGVRSGDSTPLHQAAGSNFSEATEELLRRGADRLAKDARGRTALELAELCGFEESAAVLRDWKGK